MLNSFEMLLCFEISFSYSDNNIESFSPSSSVNIYIYVYVGLKFMNR
jgi:hypothetical protein